MLRSDDAYAGSESFERLQQAVMERGSLSEDRKEDGSEEPSDMELLRLAVPRRTFTMSQMEYVADRLAWLYQHRDLIGGLRWMDEPTVLRFFIGKLDTIGAWENRLLEAVKADSRIC